VSGCPHDAVLCAHDLAVEYRSPLGPRRVVDGVDLRVGAGEIVGLVGESGAGKSTAALALMRLARTGGRLAQGEVWFKGRDLAAAGEEELRRVRGGSISLVVQNPRGALNPMLTVGRQVANVVRAHEGASKAQARARALEMLALVGINDPARRLQAYPSELSGGMAQRALIAMALACSPEILIADEPTSGLDVTIQAQILDDLHRGAQTTGSSVLIVTQDLGVVANYCDRLYVMERGAVVEAAEVRAFFARPRHPASKRLLARQTEEPVPAEREVKTA
jgi:ABC-type dipeptide/oligopeptide/nickel transport system ATPase component